MAAHDRSTPLPEIGRLFLRLGATAFGGPAAHIAMMEDEVVRRRGWLTREQFLDYVGATNLIPGPNSTELALHIGHSRGGWPGLVVAGVSFILPATVLVSLAAWGYVRYGTLPDASGVLYGLKAVVIAIVAQALWGLGRSAVKTPFLAVCGLAAIALVSAGFHELTVLAGAGVLAGAATIASRRTGAGASAVVILGVSCVSAAAALTPGASAAVPIPLWPLFMVFAKAGAVLFGSGYVLLAFLRADLVERLAWLTEAQLLDAVAIGQVTPGPVSATATFIGWVLAGPAGAAAATVGIFLPAFVFVALSGPLVPRLRQSVTAGAVLDGVNVASLALMAVVSVQLARAALIDAITVGLAAGSLIALTWFRLNSVWLLGAGAAVGWLFR